MKNLCHGSSQWAWVEGMTIYNDAGYFGSDFREFCEEHGVRLICATKKNRNGTLSHVLSPIDRNKLKCRVRVEHVNSSLKQFRGIATKNVREINIYKTFLMLGVTCVSMVNN